MNSPRKTRDIEISRQFIQYFLQELFLKHVKDREDDKHKQKTEIVDSAPKVADWRFGPAQLWYDMLDVSETGEEFDYGLKTKEVTSYYS